jgi:hypothetical protein
MIERINDFVRENADKWLESPRKIFLEEEARGRKNLELRLNLLKIKLFLNLKVEQN